ncbi:hypothetical protein [Roseibium sp.]|uniref:NACHT domain-containing protein n=1 Tax=Roseibium sp. TaxID=1936156 RepID=UPI001B222E2A|nr:hypothetical protein [Roseibium sp.]MBO6855691.1 hypothetical protein [Roseibium sp.]
MTHVARRIEITRPDGNKEILPEEDFAALGAPLVLLGEPGAGKSDTADFFSERHGHSKFSADVLATEAPALGLEANIPVIDGLDETLGNGQESPLLSILKRLKQANVHTFIITCRAADWADVQNERMVRNWFGQTPTVGRLQPLNDDEIVAMVDAFGTHEAGGRAFLEEARTRNALDLARNPQALDLLLSAIRDQGWPATKTDLYQNACENFAREENEIHRSLHAERPATEIILSTAGFLYAQLLLSGKRGVNIDGQDSEFHIRLAELASDTVSADLISAAVSSLLFKASDVGTVEPYHRTIAEYLAAKWLVTQLRSGTLSFRRLETLLYKNGHVPRSLRGLHAWLATLHPSATSRFVPCDPYGCFRYGDIEQFTVEQTRQLIEQLQNLASIDPYFRSEDWDGQVGNGLARPELRDDIVDLIRNPDVPYNLSTVILESLKGTELATDIKDDLRSVVLATSMPYVSRNRALEALQFASPDEDWVQLTQALIRDDEHSSARLAVEITMDNCQLFTGEQIAEITNIYDAVNEQRSVNMSIGIAYRLLPNMSQEQKAAALSVFAENLPEERHNRSSYVRKIEERLFDTLKSYLGQGGEVSGEQLWSWLERVTRYQYRSRDWQTFTVQYFSERVELRREVQSHALANATPEDGRIINLFLSDMGEGLILQESDLVYHLERLVEHDDQVDNFVERWRAFAEWIFGRNGLVGEAEAVARRQAQNRHELQAIIDEITSRPPPSWEREHEAQKQEWAREKQRQNRDRFQSFSNIRDQVREGRHAPALFDIATAYLALFSGYSENDEPIARIEQLVGQENLEASLAGLVAACHRDDLPTPRAIAELSANENKQYFLSRVAMVGCALARLSGENLRTLPRETLLTALAATEWGLYSDEKRMLGGLETALTDILFENEADYEQFVRDTIEPLLFAGKDHVSGLHQLFESSEHADLAGRLALEWLASSGEMSAQALRKVLYAALVRADGGAFSELIAEKLQADNWPSEAHRNAWHISAFLADFERFASDVSGFMLENDERLNDLRFMMTEGNGSQNEPLTVAQLAFVIEHFAARFSVVEPPSGGWSSGDAYELARFIDACISNLGNKPTQQAQDQLERLVGEVDLANHADHARHVLAEHKRSLAEADWSQHTFADVRHVLLSGQPQTLEDLQALVMDELQELQERLQNGSFNAVRPFWNGDTPYRENPCRDLIARELEPHLIRYGVRVHAEGTMQSDTRCDLLCTIGNMDLPIEIKGQWHDCVWTAACEQLENYSEHYRANGFGIYMVLWLGNVPGDNPPGIREFGRLENANAMLEAIPERSPRPISPKTGLFVLDVSKSEADLEREGRQAKKVKMAKKPAKPKRTRRRPKSV